MKYIQRIFAALGFWFLLVMLLVSVFHYPVDVAFCMANILVGSAACGACGFWLYTRISRRTA